MVMFHDDYCIYFIYLDDACFMHAISYRCKSNIWLIKMAKILKVRIIY
jgi:hypothetical protein